MKEITSSQNMLTKYLKNPEDIVFGKQNILKFGSILSDTESIEKNIAWFELGNLKEIKYCDLTMWNS